LAEEFLLRRLADADRTRTLIDVACSTIAQSRGAIRIGKIDALPAAAAGIYRTMVRTSTGLSPKCVSRIARIEHAAAADDCAAAPVADGGRCRQGRPREPRGSRPFHQLPCFGTNP
jgi:hypothetical protein